jgi:Tol biopolymer transport system component
MEGPDNVGRPNENIYIVPADRSREPLQLTTNGPSDTYPVMTPDGRYILFLSNRGEHWAIWRIDSPAEFMGSKK